MKICVISMEDMRDVGTWSGTVSVLVNKFEKKGIEVVGFSYEGKLKHPIIGKLRKLLGYFVYLRGNMRDDEFGWFKCNAKLFRKNLCPLDADIYLFMGEHCMDSAITGRARNYTIIDRAIPLMYEYDEIHKAGINQYIKRYKKNDLISLRQMNAIFTMNEWTRDFLIKQYGLDKDKIINIGFGINVKEFQGFKDYNNKKILIVLRKGTELIKGLDLLLDAFVIARKKIPDLSLHVVGTEYRGEDGVTYYYNQPRSVTERLFQECALYAMPARLEPNGITYLEALANKTPILGLKRFAFPEFCGYGKFGFMVDQPDISLIADQLISAFSNPQLLAKMGECGQKNIRTYNWDNVVNKLLNVIGESND